jgi:hypothetical protein
MSKNINVLDLLYSETNVMDNPIRINAVDTIDWTSVDLTSAQTGLVLSGSGGGAGDDGEGALTGVDRIAAFLGGGRGGAFRWFNASISTESDEGWLRLGCGGVGGGRNCLDEMDVFADLFSSTKLLKRCVILYLSFKPWTRSLPAWSLSLCRSRKLFTVDVADDSGCVVLPRTGGEGACDGA